MTVIERLAKAACLAAPGMHFRAHLGDGDGPMCEYHDVHMKTTRAILEEMMSVTEETKTAAVGNRAELKIVADAIIQAAIRHILEGGE